MPLSDVQKRTLLATSSCGDAVLREYLLGILEDDCVPLACPPQLEYWETLLDLIEAAQLFSRSRIDESRHNASSMAKSTSTTVSTRTSTAENTATGRNCSWQTAVSEQSFSRTSTDDTVAFSESNSQRFAQSKEDGFDKSTRSTVGNGSTSFSHHTREERDQREVENINETYSQTTVGGTSPLLPYEGGDLVPPFIDLDLAPPFFDAPIVDNNPRYNIPFGAVCPPPDPDDPRCVRPTIPSIGHGFTRDIKVRVGISVLVFSITFELGYRDGLNERIFYTRFCTSIIGDMARRRDDIHTSRFEQLDTDVGTSRETSTQIHLVRRVGSSIRRGTATTDAEERQRGYADGVANNSSERDGTGFGHTQSRREALTTGRSEMVKLATSHSESLDTANKYGQIAQHLAEMHKRILHQIMLLSRQIVATSFGGHMGPVLAAHPYPISRCFTPHCRVQGFCSCGC